MRLLLPLSVLLALACSGGTAPSLVATDSVPASKPDSGVTVLEAYGYAPNAYPKLDGTLHMGVDGGNLRERPAEDAPIVAEVALGAEVTVLETASEPVLVVDRLQRWMKVKSGASTGYVFGALLTPYGGTTFDEMRGDVPWAVTYAPDGSPRVRAKLGEQVSTLDLNPTDRFEGGRITAEAKVWGDLGTEFRVQVCPWEEGDCAEAVARVNGETLEQHSVPDFQQYRSEPMETVSCENPTRIEVTATPATEVQVIGLAPELMGADAARCVRFGTGGGVLQGRSLIECAIPMGGKVYKPHLEVARFAEVDAHHWERLRCSSNLHPSLLLEELAERGIRVTDRDGIAFAPPYTPIEGLDDGSRLVRHEVEDLPELGEPAFTDAAAGPVYRSATGELVVPQPQGHLLFTWDPGVPDYLAGLPSCAGDLEHANIVPLDWAYPEPEPLRMGGEADALQLYATPETLANERMVAMGGPTPKMQALEHPFLLVKHPKDAYWNVLTHEILKPELLCEPIVYLYSDPPTRFQLALDARIEVHGSWPDHTRWSGLALPDGRVRIDGRTWPHLFWDGDVGRFEPPERGWVLRNDRGALAGVLEQAGLRGREIDEAIEAWTPILPATPWLKLGLHEHVDTLAPLHLDPPPDTSIRVLVEIEGLEGPVPIEPPRSPPPERRGRVLVEWGWVQR